MEYDSYKLKVYNGYTRRIIARYDFYKRGYILLGFELKSFIKIKPFSYMV